MSLLVIDEAHCAIAASYLKLCADASAAGAAILGLSATPTRLRPDEDLAQVFGVRAPRLCVAACCVAHALRRARTHARGRGLACGQRKGAHTGGAVRRRA